MTRNDAKFDAAESAALYAAGALSEEERVRFEQLIAGQPSAAAEVQAFAPVIDLLAGDAAPLPPPPRLRDALLRRVAEGRPAAAPPVVSPQVWRSWPQIAESGDLFIKRADEGSWEPTGVDGVSVRQLFVDRSRNQMTALIRMAPGASYPRHVHDAPEECLVLEGDLCVGDTVMRRGDYQRASAGSHHGVQRTDGGCLLLITSSLSDEIY